MAILIHPSFSKLTSAPRRGESHQDILVATNSLVEGLIREHLDAAGHLKLLLGFDSGLLRNEGGQAFKIPAGVVLLRLLALAIKVLQGREASDTEALTERALSIGIDFGNLDLVLLAFEGGSKLLPHRSELLAVTTPRSEKLDEGWLARLENYLVEVVGDEVQYCGLGCSCRG